MMLAIALEEAATGHADDHQPPRAAAGAGRRCGRRRPRGPRTGAAQLHRRRGTLYARARGSTPRRCDRGARGSAAGRPGCACSAIAALDSPRDAAPHLLFDYFAGLLHDGLDPQGTSAADRRAAAVDTGRPGCRDGRRRRCGGSTRAAVRTNLFTERVDGGTDVYRLHPLFRDFLVERGRRTLTPTSAIRCCGTRASEFARAGRDRHRDRPGARRRRSLDGRPHGGSRCSRRSSPAVSSTSWGLERARSRPVRSAPSRLLYGRARICFLREDAAALHHYESACVAFELEDDLVGQQLCAAGVLEWIYNTDSFIDHQRWCELMFRYLEKQPAHEEHALRLLNGRLLACFFSGEFDRDAAAWTDRVLALLTPVGFANEKLSAAITLLGCLNATSAGTTRELLADRWRRCSTSAMAAHADPGAPADRGRPASADRRLRRRAQACAAGARTGQPSSASRCSSSRRSRSCCFAAQYIGDTAETERLLAEMATCVDRQHLPPALLRQKRAWHELQTGRLAAAREHADALRAAVDEQRHAGAVSRHLAADRDLRQLRRRPSCGRLRRARRAWPRRPRPARASTLRANLLTLQAWRHWDAGRRRRGDAGEAWALAATIRYYQLLAPLRSALAAAAAFALARGDRPASRAS